MKFEQGAAPAILFQDGKIAFEFKSRKLETSDKEIQELLIKHGATCIDEQAGNIDDAVDTVEPIDVAELEKIETPEDYKGLTKAEMAEKAFLEFGVTINPASYRKEIVAQIAALVAAKESAE